VSDLLPTPEQEAAADAICEWLDHGHGCRRIALAEDVALLLVERDEMHAAVIRRLRSVMHQLLIIDEEDYPIMDRPLREEAQSAMTESAQYEVEK